MRNKSQHLFALLLTVAMVFAACDRKKVYAHYEHSDSEGWEKTDTLRFSIPPVKEDGKYQETLGIRSNNSFPFKSLTVTVEQTVLPKGEKKNYTLNCSITDDLGSKKGDGISLFQYEFPITKLDLQKGDSIEIAIVHDMKRDILPGLRDVGIMLDKK